MKPFDIAPFALPNHPSEELRFEEPRNIERVIVAFDGAAPSRVGLSYLRRHWPQNRIERAQDAERRCPAHFGWTGIDDLFNTAWQKASVRTVLSGRGAAEITFHGVRREFADCADYDVAFRRTMGIRVEAPKGPKIRGMRVFTVSPPARTRLRVELDAGGNTRGQRLALSGYNASVSELEGGPGVRVVDAGLGLRPARRRGFEVDVAHMQPAHRYCYDDALVTFELEHEAVTVSLTALEEQGPVWCPHVGLYVARADDPTSYADYRRRVRGAKTVAQRVREHTEQSLSGAMLGQPRPHADAFCLGCKGVGEHFWIEPDGDVVLHRFPLLALPGERKARFLNRGHGRLFFGLRGWCLAGRFNDPPPALSYNIHLRRGDVLLEQKSVAAPLDTSKRLDDLAGDETLVGLVRFRFTNAGRAPAAVELPVGYSSDSGRGPRPGAARDRVRATAGRLTSQYEDRDVLRAAYVTTMAVGRRGEDALFTQELGPGERAELLLKIPFVALETERELAALDAMGFDACCRQMQEFWRREGARGARVRTPEPNMDAAYALHLPIVMITDPRMPDGLVNTSVGTATYGNYCNEGCMVQEELDVRGLPDEARRRLAVYVKHQGEGRMHGNFTDFDGVYFGTGGFEGSANYNQCHGWVMWRLADHYFMTGDEEWLRGVADSLVAAADWVFRQRRATMKPLPHSRGWEHGFLPAGGLEDVGEYYYWLVNNAMTWRGTEWTARALEANRHPEAARIRRESDAYRRDVVRGLETARRHTPLVRLRDGRWVPCYPSRLYRRGRDFGWIREVLEGSVYLLLSGLYDAAGQEGGWILDDYQDNRYMSPPYGYNMEDPERDWFARGGFSVQPNLLAGLVPYLDRDEPEVYIWMLFNAWAACYREEINAMVEHPMPVLGFSNLVPFKTSDEANAMKWLVFLYVYTVGNVLHLGRAIPREWLREGSEVGAEGVATHFGSVGVTYRSEAAEGRITARVSLELRRRPERILVRFRHPEGRPLRSVTLNGRPHSAFDAARGDVDITGAAGSAQIVAHY